MKDGRDLEFIQIAGAGDDLYGLDKAGHVYVFQDSKNGWLKLSMRICMIAPTEAPQ